MWKREAQEERQREDGEGEERREKRKEKMCFGAVLFFLPLPGTPILLPNPHKHID